MYSSYNLVLVEECLGERNIIIRHTNTLFSALCLGSTLPIYLYLLPTQQYCFLLHSIDKTA